MLKLSIFEFLSVYSTCFNVLSYSTCFRYKDSIFMSASVVLLLSLIFVMRLGRINLSCILSLTFLKVLFNVFISQFSNFPKFLV